MVNCEMVRPDCQYGDEGLLILTQGAGPDPVTVDDVPDCVAAERGKPTTETHEVVSKAKTEIWHRLPIGALRKPPFFNAVRL